MPHSFRALADRFTLPAVVFTTGACVLIVEIVATRVLAPYYGNTIFSVSGIIGVILAALSVGYWSGGCTRRSGPESCILLCDYRVGRRYTRGALHSRQIPASRYEPDDVACGRSCHCIFRVVFCTRFSFGHDFSLRAEARDHSLSE